MIGVHSLLTAMSEAGVRRILFSSSAAVYGVSPDGLVAKAPDGAVIAVRLDQVDGRTDYS